MMLIVGICGSPKKERSSTRFLLQKALEVVDNVLSEGEAKQDATIMLDICESDIRHCTGCDACVRGKPCPESEHDDMPEIEKKLYRQIKTHEDE
ncbi:MAG: hypothetical protein ACXAAP_10910 [Candidatus Thorarchaeota archaeon]|jgi:multimeric flavodoxin WrbA